MWLYPSGGRVVHAGGAQNIDYSGLYNHLILKLILSLNYYFIYSTLASFGMIL